MGYVDKAVSAHLASTLHAGFTPYNEKIADITHADTAKHTISLESLGLPPTAIVLLLGAVRISGTGYLQVYPNEGVDLIRLGPAFNNAVFPIAIILERLEYKLNVASDDFDVYCFGFWTVGQVRG